MIKRMQNFKVILVEQRKSYRLKKSLRPIIGIKYFIDDKHINVHQDKRIIIIKVGNPQ